MKEALNSIIGATPDAEMYEKIKTVILETPGVYGVHDLIVHDYSRKIILLLPMWNWTAI